MSDLNVNLSPIGTLLLDMSQLSTTIKNLMLTSVLTVLGNWFQRPNFGSAHHFVDKITDDSLELIKAHILKALQWLIDTGRAISNTVEVIQVDQHRIRVDLATVQADGREVSFSVFKAVG